MIRIDRFDDLIKLHRQFSEQLADKLKPIENDGKLSPERWLKDKRGALSQAKAALAAARTAREHAIARLDAELKRREQAIARLEDELARFEKGAAEPPARSAPAAAKTRPPSTRKGR